MTLSAQRRGSWRARRPAARLVQDSASARRWQHREWEHATRLPAAGRIASEDVLRDRLTELGDQGWELVVVQPVGRRTGSTHARLPEPRSVPVVHLCSCSVTELFTPTHRDVHTRRLCSEETIGVARTRTKGGLRGHREGLTTVLKTDILLIALWLTRTGFSQGRQ